MAQPFAKVLAEELQQIRDRRAAVGSNRAQPDEVVATDDLRAIQLQALHHNLFGVAFSGGGIRSATFNLGVLQRLAKVGLLKHVDYLSTVSGGGYVGSWLAAWIAREGEIQPPASQPLVRPPSHDVSVRNVERQLPPSRILQAAASRAAPAEPGVPFDVEPEPVYHLRSYSNYLTPKLGFLSADSWTLIAIYLRNLLLNQLLLLLLAILLIVATRLVLGFFTAGHADTPAWLAANWLSNVVSIVCGLSLTSSFVLLGWELTCLERERLPVPPETAARSSIRSERTLHFLILLPLLLAAVGLTWLFTSASTPEALAARAPADRPSETDAETAEGLRLAQALSRLQPEQAVWKEVANRRIPWDRSLPIIAAFAILHGAAALLAYLVDRVRNALTWYRAQKANPQSTRANRLKQVLSQTWHELDRWETGWSLLAGFASGAVGGALLFATLTGVLWPLMGHDWSPAVIVTLGPPLMFFIFVAGVYGEVGLLGTLLNGTQREWWSRICAWCLIYALVWLGVFGVTLLGLKGMEGLFSSWKSLWSSATLTWLITTLVGALAGSSRGTKDGRGNRGLELLGTIAPYVFIVGLAILVSWIVSSVVARDPSGATLDATALRWDDFNTPVWGCVYFLTVVAAGGAALLIWRIDANVFSLNALYANRLIRCYLGASRKKGRWAEYDPLKPYRGGAPTNSKDPARQENAVTGLDPTDDFPLRELQIGTVNAKGKPRSLPVYWGPFPLINTALNLVAGSELAWQERKAESFVLTPLYCGSNGTGYQKLEEGTEADSLTMGRAISISGAAASPNMGYHSSPALSALMTVFNVRLGWWMRNPRWEGGEAWAAQSATMGLFLVKELLGQTNEEGRDIYLSDGGHFENLGVYELIRRRCRFIIACDAGADPRCQFEDLGGLIRKCRTDFGVRIEIDVNSIRPSGEEGYSRWHCAVGKIHYRDLHGAESVAPNGEKPGVPHGILVYLKASLTGDEPPDVMNYARRVKNFPHQTTGDQFFDESQFESYRALGDHILAEVLGEPHGRMTEWFEPPGGGGEGQPHHPDAQLRALFERLQSEWGAPWHQMQENLARSSAGYIALHEILRREEGLKSIGEQLYKEIFEASKSGRPPRTMGEAHFICQVMQVMETAWLELSLDDNPTHPLKIGWSKLIQRWANTDAVDQSWRHLEPEFSAGFARFVRRIKTMDLGNSE